MAPVLLLSISGAAPQETFEDDQPLLPRAISDADLEMSGRYAHQWKQADGTLVVVFNGAFELEHVGRKLSADNAVVWIKSQRDPDLGKYYELTVYLSGRAEVVEPGGTITEDLVLLVTNLRTTGHIIKHQDAHVPESVEDSPFYQQAVADRERIEGLTTREVAGPEEVNVEVASPKEQEKTKRPPRAITYRFGTVQPASTSGGDTVEVVTGGVYLSQTGDVEAPSLEIRAESAVVFLAAGFGKALMREETSSRPADDDGQGVPASEAPPSDQPKLRRESSPETPDILGTAGIQKQIRAVYLEGDVVLSLGNRFVRASRIYYDFERDQAVILDAVVRADMPDRGVPLYVRAHEIRQLSAREFEANNALVSTSEFYLPHYHVGVERVYIQDSTDLNAAGRPSAGVSGDYELSNATLNAEGMPLLWWPYSKGTYSTSETLLKSFRSGYSDDFGAQVRTSWYLFNMFGITPPEGYDATLNLDYLSDRGPGIGADFDYHRDDYYGLMRNYYIHDDGEDNLGPLRNNEPDTDERGRVLWRHRHFLPNDWEATLEFAYVSDPGFLEEYEKSEWFEGKDQETVLYLKRTGDVDAVTLLANWRLLDFVTQTEHLPEVTYRRMGDTLLEPLILYHESRVGAVRYRPDDRRFFNERNFTNDGLTDATFRTGLRQEAELPIKLPGFNLVPFATFHGNFWDGQPLDEGSLWRGLGVYGLRGAGYLSKVYDEINSELLDIHRIRHVIQPRFIAWWSHSNARAESVTPFDEGIETIDDFYGFMAGVKQTWQTKRGGDAQERTVDLLTLNLEVGVFGDRQPNENTVGYVNYIRPEDSRTRNYFAGEATWRISDTTSLLYDFNLDLNSWSFDRHDVSLAIERMPRLAYVFGWRHAGDIDLDLLGGGYNYKLNEKHITAMRAWYDIDRGQLGEITFSYIRRLPRWYFAFTVDIDDVFDDVSFSVSVWPEGIPEWTIGSRRFTGLSTTTGIRP